MFCRTRLFGGSVRFLSMACAASLLACGGGESRAPTPTSASHGADSGPPPWHYDGQPPDPVPLTADTIDAFILFVAGSVRSQQDYVRAQIDAARGSDVIANGLFAALARTWWMEDGENRCPDTGIAIIILEILTQLGDGPHARELEAYVTRPLPAPQQVPDGMLDEREVVEMLESAAVDALVCVDTDEARAMVQRIVAEHPSRAVRVAASEQVANRWCKFAETANNP